MPTAPLRPCTQPGCAALVPKGKCATHAGNPAHGWGNNSTRIRGEKLQRLRKQLFDRQPLCVLCLAEGRTSIATIRDHVISMAEGGSDSEENVQAICEACHQKKTEQEAKRGMWRSR